jgi:ABC-type bacteriocin/lantibiotic exporter with double-glycine peptidase domain
MSEDFIPFSDPLFKAAPRLKRVIFPRRETFNHEDALLSCFETLCLLDKKQTKPSLDPFATTFDQLVEQIAFSCGYRVREINIHTLSLATESTPFIVFDLQNSFPKLIFYKESSPYIYDPTQQITSKLSSKLLKNLQVLGFSVYKQFPQRPLKIKDVGQFALQETSTEFKRYLWIQSFVAILALFHPILTGMLFDDILSLWQYSLMDQIFFALAGILFITTLFKALQNQTILRLQTKGGQFVQSALWDRALSFHLKFFKLFRLGDIHERLSSVDNLQRDLTLTTINAVFQGIFSIITLGLICYYLPLMGIIILGLSFVFFSLSVFMIRRMIQHHRAAISTEARLLSFLFEGIRSVIKIKTTGSQQKAFTRWLNLELSKMSHTLKAQYILIHHNLLQFGFPIISTLILYALVTRPSTPSLGILTTPATPLTLGQFISIQVAMGQFFGSLMGLVGVIDQLLHLVPVIERTRPILSETGESQSKELQTPFLKGKVSLKNVFFRYHKQDPFVLNDITLTIHPGEWVAIVGPSGAGKSTLLKLLLGLDTCDKGTIYFDDIPLKQLNLPRVRRQIGSVLQQISLLPGSIIENFRSVNPVITEHEMWLVLKHVALADDVEAMPMGLHTPIAADGRTFSMGQRQRLALARCLAKPNSLILLDEATSSLDNISQNIVLNTLKQIPLTRIMVAHRLSTIRYADRIIVMDKGQIIEEGTYDDLIHRQGLFHRMVALQQQQENSRELSYSHD